MKTLRAEFGQSVREQTVWSVTTKDSAGTFSVNCYETKAGDQEPADVARLGKTKQGISSDQSSAPEVYGGLGLR